MEALRLTTTRLRVVVLVGLVIGLLPVLAPAPANADAGLEQQFVHAVNAERTAAGLATLSPAGDLTTAARRHAGTMASAEHLHHNPNLGGAVGGWEKIGENVGRGPTVDAIHQAFMDSPGHRRNVLDPAFTEVGIGVVVRDGQIWVTEMFRRPVDARPVPTPEPTPEPTAEPAPEPIAEPTPAPAAEPEPESAPEPDAGDTGDADATDDADDPSLDVPVHRDRMMIVQLRLAAQEG